MGRKLLEYVKDKIALGISIVGCILLYFILNALVAMIGEPTYIDFGKTITVSRDGGLWEEDINGEATDIGFYIIIVSVMLSWRIYHWVISGKLSGGLRADQRIAWFYWLLGLTAYILLTTPIWNIKMPGIIHRVLVITIGVGIGRFSYRKCQASLSKVRNEQSTS